MFLSSCLVWFDVGEWRSKAPTMVSVREVDVEFCLMLGNGGARKEGPYQDRPPLCPFRL